MLCIIYHKIQETVDSPVSKWARAETVRSALTVDTDWALGPGQIDWGQKHGLLAAMARRGPEVTPTVMPRQLEAVKRFLSDSQLKVARDTRCFASAAALDTCAWPTAIALDLVRPKDLLSSLLITSVGSWSLTDRLILHVNSELPPQTRGADVTYQSKVKMKEGLYTWYFNIY